MTAILPTFFVTFIIICTLAGAAEEKPLPEGLRHMRDRTATLPDGQRKIAEFLLDHDRRDNFSTEELAAAGWRDDMTLADLMRPDGDLYAVVHAIAGGDEARTARRLVERSVEFAVPLQPLAGEKRGRNVIPRTMRSREAWRHAPRALRLITQCLRAAANGFDVRAALEPDADGTFFKEERSGLDKLYFPAYLGYLLDEKDEDGILLEEVKQAVRSRLGGRSDNGPCGFLFAGILASHSKDAHAFLGKIFSDDKNIISDLNLKELVREIPFWTLEGQRRLTYDFGFEPLYNPIGEEAILRWLGIDNRRSISGKIYNNIGEAIMQVLATEWERSDGLRRGNSFWNYLCLWAYGQFSIEDAAAAMLRMLDGGDRIIAYSALYFATRLDNYHWRIKAASKVFSNAWFRYDPKLVFLAAECLRWNGSMDLRLTPEPIADVRDRNEVALTLAERGIFAEGLLRTLEDLAARGMRTQETTFGWSNSDHSMPVSYSVNDLAAFTVDLVRRLSAPPRDSAAIDAANERVRDAAKEWGLEVRLPELQLDGGYTLPRYTMDAFSDRLCRLLPVLSKTTRKKILADLIQNGSANPEQRASLIWLFGEDAKTAWPFAGGLVFTDDEYKNIESVLADADDQTEVLILVKILQRDPDGIGQSLRRLVADDNPRRRRAGYQLAAIFERKKDDSRYADQYAACRALIENGRYGREFGEFLQTAKIGPENGYGLYDPAKPLTATAPDDALRELADKAGEPGDGDLAEKISAFIIAVHDILKRNAGHEYISYYDIYHSYSKDIIQTVVDPGKELFPEVRPDDGPERRERMFRRHYTLDDFPLAEQLRALTKRFDSDTIRLAGWARTDGISSFNYSVEEVLKDGDWLKRFRKVEKEINTPWHNDSRIRITAKKIASLLTNETTPMTRYPLLRFITGQLMTIGKRESGYDGTLGDWLRVQGKCAMQGARLFVDFFHMVYGFMHSPEGLGVKARFFSAEELVQAWSLDLLPEDEFTRLLVDLGVNGFALDKLTDPDWRKKHMGRVPELCALVDEIAERAVFLETRRGQLPTRVSGLVGCLRRVEGAKAFVDIVNGNAGRRYYRDDDWWRRLTVLDDKPLQLVMSHLLRISHPSPDDTPDSLRRALEGRDIPRDWLLTAADFAPQWRGLIQEYMGVFW